MLGLQVETLLPFCVTGQSWSQVSGLILCVFSKLGKNEHEMFGDIGNVIETDASNVTV